MMLGVGLGHTMVNSGITMVTMVLTFFGSNYGYYGILSFIRWDTIPTTTYGCTNMPST